MALRLNESWRFENWDLIWWINCRRGPCGLNGVGQSSEGEALALKDGGREEQITFHEHEPTSQKAICLTF